MNHTQECYGKIFPDVLHIPSGKPVSGKVFTVLLECAGGMIRSDRSITADADAWGKCMKCPAFDNCYKFSIAKLTLASAIISQ